MPYIDSHAHLTSSDYTDAEIDEVLERARLVGVEKVINICTDEVTLARAIEVKKRHSHFYITGATTPHDVAKEGERAFGAFEEAAKKGHLVAIGETGLDYYYEHSNRATQKLFAKRYFALARESRLPIVIHCREAFKDLFQLLDDDFPEFGTIYPGILHCFTGTIDEAQELITRGWYISFSGIVTFKKSHDLRLVAQSIPLDRLLIETDSPYLAPQSRRGKRNEPSYLPETAATIADVRGITQDEVEKASWLNAHTIFSL